MLVLDIFDISTEMLTLKNPVSIHLKFIHFSLWGLYFNWKAKDKNSLLRLDLILFTEKWMNFKYQNECTNCYNFTIHFRFTPFVFLATFIIDCK